MYMCNWGLPRRLSGKESAGNAGDSGLIPGLRRSPGGGHGNQPQYSCLENPIDRGAWWTTVYRGTKNETQQRQFSICVTESLCSTSVLQKL